MKAVILTRSSWREIKNIIATEHPISVLAIRDKTKRVLGFTVREHQRWITVKSDDDSIPRGYHKDEIHLDFYSEHKRTMFLLKFSEHIRSEDNNEVLFLI
jgi:hypothetical protein